jgi:hypothetical protein
MNDDDDRYIDELVQSHRTLHSEAEDAHSREHGFDHDAVASWIKAHDRTHISEQRAVETAFSAERTVRGVHAEAHLESHQAHEDRFSDQRIAHNERHDAEDRAEVAALAAMDKRLESMNQFREQLRDQTANFVRTDAFEQFRDERRHALEALDQTMDRRFEELRNLIATEREERRESLGVRKGAQDNRSAIYAGVGITGTLLGILIIIMNLIGPALQSTP